MPGNEIEVIKYFISNMNRITLPHLGLIQSVGYYKNRCFVEIHDIKDISSVSSNNSYKKADIYLNRKGVSIKQSGSVFDFNRLQRAELPALLSLLDISNISGIIQKLDDEIDQFNQGLISPRDRDWREIFSEVDFKKILKYLMMEGSPNVGISDDPAEFILEAPTDIRMNTIKVYSFVEYFEYNKDHFKISLRRQWIGQSSRSEHGRAVSLARKEENRRWMYDHWTGGPRSWKTDFPEDKRKVIYFLMFSKT
jgi:hypothetical protein